VGRAQMIVEQAYKPGQLLGTKGLNMLGDGAKIFGRMSWSIKTCRTISIHQGFVCGARYGSQWLWPWCSQWCSQWIRPRKTRAAEFTRSPGLAPRPLLGRSQGT